MNSEIKNSVWFQNESKALDQLFKKSMTLYLILSVAWVFLFFVMGNEFSKIDSATSDDAILKAFGGGVLLLILLICTFFMILNFFTRKDKRKLKKGISAFLRNGMTVAEFDRQALSPLFIQNTAGDVLSILFGETFFILGDDYRVINRGELASMGTKRKMRGGEECYIVTFYGPNGKKLGSFVSQSSKAYDAMCAFLTQYTPEISFRRVA